MTPRAEKLTSHLYGWRWLVVALVIGAGLAIRVTWLDLDPFSCDEAESSINALTILQHGYPTDSYRGLPIYENTLVRPWPGHPEYEFKDISYSDRGMAVYHGWLPLYAIATSFALHQIKPDPPVLPPDFRRTLEEFKYRTRAGRLPSVLFGLALLLVAFVAGNAFHGAEAGWIALLTAAVHPRHIYLSREARYYSATVALSTGCCLMVWLMITKGRWRDFLLGAILFVLLFHTHLLSFVSAATFLALSVLVVLLRRQKVGTRPNWRKPDWGKIAAFGSIVAAGTIPWVLLTGFHQHQSQIPRAWSLLSLPGDFFRYLPAKPVNIAIGLFFFLVCGWLTVGKSKRAARMRSPLLDSLFPALFLLAWVVCGYFSFFLYMPAASFYTARLSLSYWGAALLLGSIICAAMARAVTQRVTGWNVLAGVPLMALAIGNSLVQTDLPATRWNTLEQVFDSVRDLNPQPDTKLYAMPNDHLIYTFYGGLPFQSIAPVRKSFLDSYPGDVVIVEPVHDWRPDSVLSPSQLQQAAQRSGEPLSQDEAFRLSAELVMLDYQQTMTRNVTGVSLPPRDGLPTLALNALQTHQARTREVLTPSANDILILRGFSVANWRDGMDVIFYRFVNPDSRRGSKRNDMQRLRGARAFALVPHGFVVFHAKGGSRAPQSAGIDFTFVRQ